MKIDARGIKLVDLLQEKLIYEIPDYQRPYSWTENEIDDLLNDLKNSINNKTSHYFGAFVLNTERMIKDSVIEIIDGQQRITSVCILLYAIRAVYENLNFSSSEIIGKVNFRKSTLMQLLHLLNGDGDPIGPKLILGDTNRDFFNEYIVKGWNKTKEDRNAIINKFKQMKKYEVSKAISNSFETIYENLMVTIKNLTEEMKFTVIKEYQDKILNEFDVVKIEVTQDSDAFLIFETLNDRGLELSAIDLIKNRLFKNCASLDEFEEVKNKWTEMTTYLEDVTLIKKYIKHYWISKHEFVSNQNLYTKVREKIGNDKQFSKDLIEDLNKVAYDYYDITHPNESNLSNKMLIKTLEDMNTLGYDLTHPIILAGFEKFRNDEEKMYKLVKLCLNFLVRYITIMKGKPGTVEKEIGECARNFNSIEDVSKLFLKYAKDSEFKEHFKNITMNYRSEQTYYVLVEYEKTLHNNEAWVTPGRKDVTIEHILPRTIDFSKTEDGEWGSLFTKEDHEIYINKLGNLTLLGARGQSKVSNKKFSEKKALYSTYTDMKSTVELLKYDKWTKNDIEKRQEKIADAAVKIFTLNL